MKIIPIKIPNKQASRPCFVDDEDYTALVEIPWLSRQNPRDGSIYAKGRVKDEEGKWRSVYLHRLILKLGKGVIADHINGNGLDNRRANLRVCTRSQNGANTRKSWRNSSGFKGVSWRKDIEKWQAQISKDRKSFFLGQFTSKEDAARAYNQAAIKLFGEFARVNRLD